MCPVARKEETISPMAVNRNIKVPLSCPHLTISSLLLITSLVTLVGSLAMEYEFSILFGNCFMNFLEMPVLFLIVGSVLVFADACLGLISLSHRWYHGVIMFLVCTTCLLVAMIALLALAYVYLNTEEEAMFSKLEGDLKNNQISMEAIDTVQFILKCCGYNNFSDWTNETSENIPQSCCVEGEPCDTNNSWEIHSTGCYQAMSRFLDCRKWIIVVVLVVMGLVEIVAIMLSFVVCRHYPREITAEPSTADNGTSVSTALPRVKNPLGQSSWHSVDNNGVYVRRPTQQPAVLNYRSPHERFLRQPPQLRFDRRVMLTGSKLKNPYARPG